MPIGGPIEASVSSVRSERRAMSSKSRDPRSKQDSHCRSLELMKRVEGGKGRSVPCGKKGRSRK
jgi:hypothetical protein